MINAFFFHAGFSRPHTIPLFLSHVFSLSLCLPVFLHLPSSLFFTFFPDSFLSLHYLALSISFLPFLSFSLISSFFSPPSLYILFKRICLVFLSLVSTSFNLSVYFFLLLVPYSLTFIDSSSHTLSLNFRIKLHNSPRLHQSIFCLNIYSIIYLFIYLFIYLYYTTFTPHLPP